MVGGGILLLLGAPVKSKFDGLKSRKHWCSWFSDFWNPWEPLFVDLNIRTFLTTSKKKSQIIFEKHYFRNVAFENLELVNLENITILEICFCGFEYMKFLTTSKKTPKSFLETLFSKCGIRKFGTCETWEYCNLGNLFFWNLEISESWNLDILKLWNFETLPHSHIAT